MTTTTTSASEEVERGMAHFHANRYEEAMAAFEHTLALNPNCAPAWNGIGRVLERIGTAESAIEAYERGIDINSRYDAPYYGIGMVHVFMRNDYEQALAAFRRGLEVSPGNAAFINQIGATYARMGRFDEAIEALEQSLALNPSNTFALGWLSMLTLRQGRYDEALALCQREIAVEEAHSPHRIMGMIHNHLGDRDSAITHLERAIALEPQDYEARAVLAQVYRAVGRRAEADEQYSLANEMAGQDEEYGKACVQALRGNVDEAVALLKIALPKKLVQPGWVRIDPEFAFIADDPRFKTLIGE